MVTNSLSTNIEQNSQVLNKDHSTIITFIVITKDHSQQVKQLVTSILKANLNSLSLLLIDDSNPNNFAKNQAFLKALSIPFQHFSSNQAIKLVEHTLEKASLNAEELNFIRDCTGIELPFQGFVEQFLKLHTSKKSFNSPTRYFAPYSIARNLGIYCAVRCFRPEIIFFLDDDCRIFNPNILDAHVKLIGGKLNQRTIIAVSGLYRKLTEIQEKTQTIKSIVGIIRGMDAFLLKSLQHGTTRFQVKPPHMLGGALILGKQVFTSLPFDPYVARGEDHMYALDLATVINQNELFVRDSSFIVDHGGTASKEKVELNILRDIFRFLYARAKIGRSFIPFFLIRWTIASIIDLLLYTHSLKKCRLELFTLLYIGHKFAKKKGSIFRNNIRAWRRFIKQITQVNTES